MNKSVLQVRGFHKIRLTLQTDYIFVYQLKNDFPEAMIFLFLPINLSDKISFWITIFLKQGAQIQNYHPDQAITIFYYI